MKSKEEIEELGFLKYPRFITDPYNPMEDDNSYERKIWIDGYTQCKEDMAPFLDIKELYLSKLKDKILNKPLNKQD